VIGSRAIRTHLLQTTDDFAQKSFNHTGIVTLSSKMSNVFETLRVSRRKAARWRSADGKARTSLIIGAGVLLLGLALADLVPFGNSELYRAIWDGDEARALELIRSGANPNSTWGATHKIETENRAVRLNPLHFALARAQPRVAVALIEAGADPNSRDDAGNTALIVAANKNLPAVVRALLTKGADPNTAGAYGETPLHNAPNGPGGRYPGFGKIPKSLTPEIREQLVKAGAK
jgi:hypothetical protein